MQLRHDQLNQHLQKELAPLYLISGEVPLLMQETCDAIRQAATKNGFVEHEVLSIDTGFNWSTFTTLINTRSLFSNKQLLELRITNTFGETAGKTLKNYTEQPVTDKTLLITTGKLDSKTQQTAWFQALNKIGVIVQIWPIEIQQLPAWIAQRLAKAELQTEPAGIQLLAEHAEGNLLACAQEIEKLKLIYGKGHLSIEAITKVVSNSARFDVFNAIDATLQGEYKRIINILHGLKNEGTEPILVLWAIARELRSLASMANDLKQGHALEKILQTHRVWEKRKPLIRRALKLHSTPILQNFLQQAHQIDCMIKGLKTGNVWNELQNICLAIAGNPIYEK